LKAPDRLCAPAFSPTLMYSYPDMNANQGLFTENSVSHRKARLTIKLERLEEYHLTHYTL
jgi:hypothetical protein